MLVPGGATMDQRSHPTLHTNGLWCGSAPKLGNQALSNCIPTEDRNRLSFSGGCWRAVARSFRTDHAECTIGLSSIALENVAWKQDSSRGTS